MDRFGYTVVASSLHDRAAIDHLTAPIRALLDALGGRRVEAQDPDCRSHVAVVGTGGTEHALMALRAKRMERVPDEPFVMLAHGAHNSLPAALEALAAIRHVGGRGRIVQLSGEVSDRPLIDLAISDLDAISRFRSTRLGLIGGASDWLVASRPDPAVVRRRWGPQVVVVDTTQLVGLAARAPEEERDELAARFGGSAPSARPAVSGSDVVAACAVGAGLQRLVEAEGLDAVAVRCFDILDDPGTSGCVALAALNDVGVVAGCEGDLPSTLAMLWIRYLLDQPAWMANPAFIDVDGNAIALAHCTVAPTMVDRFTLSTHFESGIGVGIGGRFAEQPVTLIRIGGVDLDECWIAEGAIISSPSRDDRCRTQAVVELRDRSASDLLERPLGNHLVLAAGHHGARLRGWWRLAIR